MKKMFYLSLACAAALTAAEIEEIDMTTASGPDDPVF